MAQVPFELSVEGIVPHRQRYQVSCTQILRQIPGNRIVYAGYCDGRDVIAKVFYSKIKGKRRLRKEWKALQQLRQRGLNSPEPFFYGTAAESQWVMVLDKITDSATALEYYERADNQDSKNELIALVVREIAKLHAHGVLQKDLHLGNFLVTGERLLVLDFAQMRFFRRGVGKKASISQLAILASYLPDNNTVAAKKLCQEYFSTRGWHLGKSDWVIVQKQITARRNRGIKRGLKKRLRTNKRYLRIKAGRYFAMFDRNFCRGAEPLDFMEKVDALMHEGEILKDGATCYVSRLRWNNRDVVVKRYNHKGFIHSLRHTMKKSRARRGWLHAHRLRMLQIPTPKPSAYIEQRKQKLVWKSYLVTEYVEGMKLRDFLRDGNITEEERSTVAQQVEELLDELGKYRITHGDLKHSNILIADNKPMITDLDGLKVHRLDWMYEARRKKDLQCLTRIRTT